MRVPSGFGLVACACVLVFGGLAALAAAAEFEVEGTAPVSVLGKEVSGSPATFTLDGTKVECEKVEFEGSMSTIAQKTLEVTPKYTSCKGFGGGEATVSMGSCKYKFLEASGEGPYTGSMSVTCPEGAIKLSGNTCEAEIKAQGPSSGLTYEERSTTPLTLRVKSALEKLTYNRTKDGAFCPFTGTGNKEDGKYSGTADFEGSQEGAVAFGMTNTWMASNPNEVAFPTEIEVGKSAKQSLEFNFVGKVRNSVNILDARIENTAGTPYKIINNACKKGKLVKGTPCKLEVEFVPEKKGEVTATVVLEEDGGLHRHKDVNVRGTGK